MTATEKISLFHGSCRGYTGNVCANTRLGIPALKMNDGPQGFRGAPSTSTAFPAAITVAASFDPLASEEWGKAMGSEFYRKGANVQVSGNSASNYAAVIMASTPALPGSSYTTKVELAQPPRGPGEPPNSSWEWRWPPYSTT